MFDYGFIEGEDYVKVFPENRINPSGGRPSRKWAITLDMAKEISMIQRTTSGPSRGGRLPTAYPPETTNNDRK